MYCSSCGVLVTQALSYCKNCGAKVNRGDDEKKSSELTPNLLVTSMVATFVFGLGVITVLMGVLRVIVGLRVEPVLALAIVPFLLLLVLEAVFIRLLLRRTRGAQSTRDTRLTTDHATNELDAAHARALPEGLESVSVTEHTTRAFDPIYTERK